MPLKLSDTIKRLFIKDELCGVWHSDDGTGFMIIMGSWMKIKPNGTGVFESWSNSDDDTGYYVKGEFNWKRIDKNTIQIQEIGSDNIETITYKLTSAHGRVELTSPQPELQKFGIEAFWNFAQVMFKR